MSRRKTSLRDMNPAIYICICTLFSYLLLVGVTFIASVVINLTDNPSALVGAASFISLLVTAAVGSFTAARLKGEGGGLCAMLTAALFITVRIVVSLFLSGTDISDLLDCLCYLGVGVIFALLGSKKRRRRR